MRQKLFITAVLLLGTSLFAQGRIIIPQPPPALDPGQVILKEVYAQIDLTDGAGSVTLEQVFFNQSAHTLEGTYLFPVPHDAQLSDFYLYINGQKTKGQLLDSDEARQTYEQIVRSLRDPALLEYVDHNLFKARIFPIEPKQERKIELTYAQALQIDNGMYRFTLPIRSVGQPSIESFELTLNLSTSSGLANIYSPSHSVDIIRQSQNRAKITLHGKNMQSDKDLILYFSFADQEINSSLLTFRPRTDRDGYFMFMASPRFIRNNQLKIPSDFIFVMDVSGSMQGEKIMQARNALNFCLNALDRADRFEIISFSSGVHSFQNALKTADAEAIKNARYFVSNLNANGGTNINEALQKALHLKARNDQRPTSIIFLTDGLPTEGEQNIANILQNVQGVQKEFMRIFSFGVGYDVNTFLLDKLSADGRGSANYVKPGENIEKQVSTLFAKISAPVLTDPRINFGHVQVYDLYPKNLPEIFEGQRVMVLGRYRKSGSTQIRLSGQQAGNERHFNYKKQFKKRDNTQEFIAKLWANRKVANLMMQIRFNGENPELVESVKALGNTYGIVTPYTSYLVTEQQNELAMAQSNKGTAVSRRLQARKHAQDRISHMDEEAVGSSGFFSAISAKPSAANASSGKKAVISSRILNQIAETEKETDMLLTVKRVSGKTFRLQSGIWQEQDINSQKYLDIRIPFASTAYFKLVEQNPTLKSILAVGVKIRFEWAGKTYQIE